MIVFVNRVYPPTDGATGKLLRELAEALADGGVRVVVLTGPAPENPGGMRREMVNGVEVIRVRGLSLRRSSHWRRALGYAALYPQFAWQIWRLGRVDALVTMTDPPMQLALGLLSGRRVRQHFHWAQDVYPEVAERLGVIREGGMVAHLLRKISSKVMRGCEDVIVPGRCMRDVLLARGVSAAHLEVIPNWSSMVRVDDEDISAIRGRFRWQGKFIVLYSGNIGLAHDFDTVAEAVRMCRGDEQLHFVFAGEGPRLAELRTALEGVPHVEFLPPQTSEDLPAFLAAADVHLVTVRKGLSGMVVPSKTYGILAAGRPVVYVGHEPDEVARLLAESGAGVVLANNDSAGLARTLQQLADQPERMRVMAVKAHEAAKKFTFANALRKWKELLQLF